MTFLALLADVLPVLESLPRAVAHPMVDIAVPETETLVWGQWTILVPRGTRFHGVTRIEHDRPDSAIPESWPDDEAQPAGRSDDKLSRSTG